MKSKGPKFSIGDLVFFSGEYMANMVEGLGVIVSSPELSFFHDWKDKRGMPNEFWTYDVKVEEQLFKMIPEQFLKRLTDEN